MPGANWVTIPKFDAQGDPDQRHKRLVEYARRLVQMSETVLASRWDQWQETDRRMRAFVDVTESDKITGRARRPHDVKLVLPLSYAIHYSLLTYYFTVFTAKDKLFPLEGRTIDSVKSAQLMEEVLDYDVQRQNAELVLYAMLNDALKYGIGAIQDEWYEEWTLRTTHERESVSLFGVELGSRRTKTRKWERTYNGNRTKNIDPYTFLWDPRVPAGRHHDGDFVGFSWFDSWTHLKHMQNADKYQNVDELEAWSREKAMETMAQSARWEALGLPLVFDQQLDEDDRGFVYGVTLWIQLVPSDWDLGPGDDPEIWVLTMGNYDTILRLQRWEYDYGTFPTSVIEPHFDGYSPLNQGATEIVQPLTDLMDWLMGAHLANVKKAINDSFVLDPSRINTEDLEFSGPAKWIRLKRNAWGTDVRTAITQLQVQDFTRQHVADVQQMMDWVIRATGALDPMLGMQPRTKQQATVFSGLVQMAAARHKVGARLMSQMGLLPWARRLVSNIQQHLDEDTFVKITGTKARQWGLDPYERHILRVTPEDIQGQFDFPVHTGDIPPDPGRNAEMWKGVLETIAKIPALAQRFDLVEIFRQLVYSTGIRNIDAFLVKTQVMPDERVMQMLQQGNLKPAAEVLRGNGGQTGPGADAGAGGGRRALPAPAAGPSGLGAVLQSLGVQARGAGA